MYKHPHPLCNNTLADITFSLRTELAYDAFAGLLDECSLIVLLPDDGVPVRWVADVETDDVAQQQPTLEDERGAAG
jgi:hypothetical protein